MVFADGGGKLRPRLKRDWLILKTKSLCTKCADPGLEITTEENKHWEALIPLTKVRKSVHEVVVVIRAHYCGADSKKGPSGRVMTFKINQTAVSGPALRLALGSEEMRSTLLSDFKIKGANLFMAGKGFGHGVGMSQWGAKALAEQGKSPEDIIRYFFKDIEIEKEWK